MKNTQPDLFTVPLTDEIHRLAQDFYEYHDQPQKAKQVYLNTLSIKAVHFYLSCLGIETDLSQSQSWNPTLQVLADTADLWVTGRGRLECRPVLPTMQECPVPVEVWSDRIGYIPVQLNAELTEATLLGFVPTVDSETLSLQKLHPLSEFPQFLSQITLKETTEQVTSEQPTRLSQWFTQTVVAGWETLEDLRHYFQATPGLIYSFRQRVGAEIDIADPSTGERKWGKRLLLNQSPEEQVLLVVSITPSLAPDEFQITVELLPVGSSAYLSRSLQLLLLDDAGQVVLQADGSQSEGLEFQFSGESNEQFTVKIQWQDQSIAERFVI